MLKISMHLILFCIIIPLTACSAKPKTETERYQRLTSSVKYKTYRGVSKSTIEAGMFALQHGSEAALQPQPIRKAHLHTTLAMLQLLSGNNTLALAEAELALQSSPLPGATADEGTYLALSMMSLTLQHHGLTQMSQSYAGAAQAVTAEQGLTQHFATAEHYAKLLLGLNAALNEDADTSYVLLRDAATGLNTPWLPRSVAAAAVVLHNPYTAPFKLQKILHETPLTAEERLYISQLQQKIISGTPEQARLKTRQMLANWLADASKASLLFTAQAAYDGIIQLSEGMLRLVARN